MSKSNHTFITYPSKDPSISVKIAGSFNDWVPEPLTYNDTTKAFEYKIKPPSSSSEQSGKYVFKFVINDEWKADQNYASEFDESGNENNVVVYDFTEDKKPTDEIEKTLKNDVKLASLNEPDHPNSTPNSFSKHATSDSQENSIAVTETLDSLDTTKSAPQLDSKNGKNEVSSHPLEPTKTSKPSDDVHNKIKFIPLTETAHGSPKAAHFPPEDVSDTEPVPNPQPVSRPEPATSTQVPDVHSSTTSESSNGTEISTNGQKSQTKTIPTETQLSQNDKTSNGFNSSVDHDEESQIHNTTENHSIRDEDRSSANYSLGFIATLLHVITAFFRRWFTGGHN